MTSVDRPVLVTQPYLPPLEEFIPYLEQIWESKWLTNNGPYHQDFERELAKFLGVEHIALFTNGTIALITALQALRVTGEVITTPLSFVATAHALLWNGVRPVFVDVDPETLNLDPKRVEAAITPQTTAILPVHCYGRPCAVEEIQKIADIYNLTVVYDAAHAFGVRDAGGSILRHGDLSVLSFHATKVFTTFEGGAIICPDAKTKLRIDRLKNFGFVDEVTVAAPGINGKMNEFSAALGLLQLQHFSKAIAARAAVDRTYCERLAGIAGISFLPEVTVEARNYSYFPILVGDEYPLDREGLYHHLRAHGIHVRRYFYPLISDFPMYRSLPTASRENLPVASEFASRLLCLPIHPGLTQSEQENIIRLVSRPKPVRGIRKPSWRALQVPKR